MHVAAARLAYPRSKEPQERIIIIRRPQYQNSNTNRELGGEGSGVAGGGGGSFMRDKRRRRRTEILPLVRSLALSLSLSLAPIGALLVNGKRLVNVQSAEKFHLKSGGGESYNFSSWGDVAGFKCKFIRQDMSEMKIRPRSSFLAAVKLAEGGSAQSLPITGDCHKANWGRLTLFVCLFLHSFVSSSPYHLTQVSLRDDASQR